MNFFPFFVQFRVASGPSRDAAAQLLRETADKTGQKIVALDTGEVDDTDVLSTCDQARFLADFIVADASEEISEYRTPTLLAGPEGMVIAHEYGRTKLPNTEDGDDGLGQAMQIEAPDIAAAIKAWRTVATDRLPSFLLRQWYPMLLMLVNGRVPKRHEWQPSHRTDNTLSNEPEATSAQLEKLMSKADALADLYAQKYRSAFVGRFVLSAVVSVFVVLMLFVYPQSKSVAYGLEFGATITIIASFRASNKGEWQRKWLSNRYLAESLRTMLELPRAATEMLLRNRKYPDDSASAEETLIDWCARQTLLKQEIWSTDDSTQFAALLASQIAYQKRRCDEQSCIERRMGKVGLTAFIGSMSLASLALIGNYAAPDLFTKITSPMAVILGILPAIGAMIFAIRVQSNFKAEALHSNTVSLRLKVLKSELAVTDITHCTKIQRRYVSLQQEEFDDWRKVHQGRALDLP